MNRKSISIFTRTLTVGLFVLLAACSTISVGIEQPTSVVPMSTGLPDQKTDGIDMPISQSPKQATVPATSANATPTKMPTAQEVATSTPVAADCVDAAQFTGADGIDGTILPPNTAFTKTWTVKNIGSCTWDSRYTTFQISGAFMTQQPGYWIMPSGYTVAPGQSLNISIDMTSPLENGAYISIWGIKNWKGLPILIQGGVNGNSFYVRILVDDSSAQARQTLASNLPK